MTPMPDNIWERMAAIRRNFDAVLDQIFLEELASRKASPPTPREIANRLVTWCCDECGAQTNEIEVFGVSVWVEYDAPSEVVEQLRAAIAKWIEKQKPEVEA